MATCKFSVEEIQLGDLFNICIEQLIFVLADSGAMDTSVISVWLPEMKPRVILFHTLSGEFEGLAVMRPNRNSERMKSSEQPMRPSLWGPMGRTSVIGGDMTPCQLPWAFYLYCNWLF